MEKFWRRDSLQSRRSRRKAGKMIEEKEGARDHNTGLARLAAGYVIFIIFYQNLKAKALGHKTRAVVGSTEISLSGNLQWWQVNFKIV